MLNVKAVQKSLPKDYINAISEKAPLIAKGVESWCYSYHNAFYSGGICDLPFTCSAFEMGQPYTDAALAKEIAEALRSNTKYLQCSVTSRDVAKRLEKFGFSKVTDYMGAHGVRVGIYHINLEGFVF